jgi:hypothetical protein
MALLDKGEAAKGVEMAVLVGLEIGQVSTSSSIWWTASR